jgi:hypothetical protein
MRKDTRGRKIIAQDLTLAESVTFFGGLFVMEQNIRDHEFFPKGNAHKRSSPPLGVASNLYNSWTKQFELDRLMDISKSFQGKASSFAQEDRVCSS